MYKEKFIHGIELLYVFLFLFETFGAQQEQSPRVCAVLPVPLQVTDFVSIRVWSELVGTVTSSPEVLDLICNMYIQQIGILSWRIAVSKYHLCISNCK